MITHLGADLEMLKVPILMFTLGEIRQTLITMLKHQFISCKLIGNVSLVNGRQILGILLSQIRKF